MTNKLKSKKKLKIFIQINLENEEQKSGINPLELDELYNFSTKNLNLDVVVNVYSTY